MIRRPGQNPGPQRSSSKRPWDRSLSMPATKATTAWRTHCRALGPKRRGLRPGSHKSFGKSNGGTVTAVREAQARAERERDSAKPQVMRQPQIGRASCRERVEISEVDGAIKNKRS